MVKPPHRPGGGSFSPLDAAMDLLADRTGRAVLVVRGDSMRPTLTAGDEVQIDLTPGKLHFGDLLLFRQADYLVVHRYLGSARRPDGTRCLRTRGDGRSLLDPPVDPAAVRGRAVAATRASRWRTLSGAGSRAWAVGVGAHDLLWAALAFFASFEPLRRIVAAVDRGLLLAADTIAFKIVHRVVSDPAERREP